MGVRSLFGSLREKIVSKNPKIVFPEGNSERVLRATAHSKPGGLIEPIILGNTRGVRTLLAKFGFADQDYVIINPAKYDQFDEMRKAFLEIHKGKVTPENAECLLQNVSYFGVMLVKFGLADRMVSSAIHSTANTIRPALQIIKTKSGISRTSRMLLMNRETTGQCLASINYAISIDPTA